MGFAMLKVNRTAADRYLRLHGTGVPAAAIISCGEKSMDREPSAPFEYELAVAQPVETFP